jgi:hypothetical protein
MRQLISIQHADFLRPYEYTNRRTPRASRDLTFLPRVAIPFYEKNLNCLFFDAVRFESQRALHSIITARFCSRRDFHATRCNFCHNKQSRDFYNSKLQIHKIQDY